jgi:putative addiction module component (TIGR02574 family)
MSPALLTEIMSLSPAEKLELIDKLWESFSPEVDDGEISDEEKKLLDDRWEKYQKNPDSALTLEELKAAVAARLK